MAKIQWHPEEDQGAAKENMSKPEISKLRNEKNR